MFDMSINIICVHCVCVLTCALFWVFFVEKNRSTKLLFKEVGVLNFLPDDRLFRYICSGLKKLKIRISHQTNFFTSRPSLFIGHASNPPYPY
jgi:hypothetical protein